MPSPQTVTWLRGYSEVRDTFNEAGLEQASYNGAKHGIFTNVLIILDGDDHENRRIAEMPLFRRDNVAVFEDRLIPETMASLLAQLGASGEADLVQIARLSTTAMAARIVGLEDCESIDRLEMLATLMAKLHEGVVIDWSLRPREEVLAEVAVAKENYRTLFFEPSFRNRAGRAQADALIDILLHHRDTLDEGTMLRETIHFLVASAHTSATVLVNAVHDLWTWLADHPEDLDKIEDPAFLQRCIHESLRLSPPSGRQLRYAATDMTLKSGRMVAAGTTIGLDLIEANRDPAIFGPTAGVFDPHRAKPQGIPLYGLAFGGGVHVCPGRRLAAGAAASSNGVGVVLAMVQGLIKAGCRPHPTRAPEAQPGTERRQYRAYPILPAAGMPPTQASINPLEATR